MNSFVACVRSMKLIDLFQTGALNAPWPAYVDGTKLQADRTEPIYCTRRCDTRSCLSGKGTRLGVNCHVGFTYFQALVGEETIVCYGALAPGERDKLPPKIRHDYKDDLKGRTLTSTQFQEWIGKLLKLTELVDEERAQITSRALEPLHETPKLAKEILNSAVALIQKQPGRIMEEKFDSAPPEARSLFKTAELLVDSFDMLSIFFNPDSAGTGTLIRCEPYKLMDKLSKIIGRQYNRNADARARIDIQGNSYRAYEVYESFKVIPLTLLDNAVKYSFEDLVMVVVSDEALGTRIAISSRGPLIEDDERERIFMRSERGRFAAQLHAQGMGVGLFVAAASAKANGTRVDVTSVPRGYERNGIPVADNTFSFVVRDAPQIHGKVVRAK